MEVKKNKLDKIDKTNKIDETNNTLTGILLNPKTFMDIVYGQKTFYIRQNHKWLEGTRVVLGSRVGHAGNGCLPGMAAALATVEKIDKVNSRLYRYTLKEVDVFEPVKIGSVFPDSTFAFNPKGLNLLDDTENTEWIESNFYPYVKGAYVNYLGEWTVPDPEYV